MENQNLQHQPEAKAGSDTNKAMSRSHSKSKQAIQREALTNALSHESTANYQAIFEGFEKIGIPMDQIRPRENVFTFNAWIALGRVVRKGQHGVKVFTMIQCEKKDPATDKKVPVKKGKTTTVFHISQTDELNPDTSKAGTITSEAQATQIEPKPADVEPKAAQTVEAVASIEAEPREPNAYELRQEAKRARYEERADAARGQSQAAYARAHSMAEAIPFGQPILVGHHSERRDRNYREKIHNTFGKAFELDDKAKHYDSKAAAVGTGGISSDDPDAIKKLRAELADVERAQERMKAANKAIRAHKTHEARIAALVASGCTEAQAQELLTPDFAQRIGFPQYALTNNNANARRIKGRIAQLEALRQRATKVIECNGFEYREDTEENRVMFKFPGKPDKQTRDLLSGHAFNWSPSRSAWVRKLNNAGIYAGQQIRAALESRQDSE